VGAVSGADGDTMVTETAMAWLLFGLSMLLNIVLGLVVFFKTALNDAVAAWFKDRREHRRQVRALLIELNGRLEPFDGNYFLLIANTHLQHHGPNSAIRDQAKNVTDSLAPKHIDTLEYMARHELDFPRSVRQRIRHLRDDMELKDVAQLKDMRAILELSQRVTDSVTAIRNDLDRMVK
jgi:hypothetical protein